MTPDAGREVVAYLQQQHHFSERRACAVSGVARATVRYRSLTTNVTPMRERLRELARTRPRYGYRRLTVLLRREYGVVNHKRVYRWYRQDGLQVRQKRRKRVAAPGRVPQPVPTHAGERWAMDFMRDTLADGRCFRTLNVVDAYTRECLAIEVDTSLPGQRVVRLMERLTAWYGVPQAIRVDNGPEFAGRVLDAWAYGKGVRLDFIAPGKPTENGLMESFNGKFRDECLNQHWFGDLHEARRLIEAWRVDYNHERPHSALGNQSPAAFAAQERGEALSQ